MDSLDSIMFELKQISNGWLVVTYDPLASEHGQSLTKTVLSFPSKPAAIEHIVKFLEKEKKVK